MVEAAIALTGVGLVYLFPVLWLLGSHSDVQRIVSRAEPAELPHPVIQYHVGIRLLSERDYAGAVEPLARVAQRPQLRQEEFRLCIYALCMLG